MEEIRIRPDREQHMFEELARLATGHVATSGGRLELLPVDPETHPAQRAYHVVGSPQSAAVVESVAAVAEPRFPELQSRVEEAQTNQREIDRWGEILKSGSNLIVATNHGDLIDIALAQAAIYCALDQRGYDKRSGIIISKMVSMLGYRLGHDVAPAAQVLEMLCDDIFLSFPRSDSMRRSGLTRFLPDEIKRHNDNMTATVRSNLAKGGQLLAIAPSGSTDKPLADDKDVISLAKVGTGTANLMTQPHTLVVPIAVWLHGAEVVFELCDVPRAVKSEAEVDAVMSDIASTLTANVPDKQFVYAPRAA